MKEAREAANTLAGEGLEVRVMELFTIKPIDVKGVITNAKEFGGRVVIVEDHYYEGTCCGACFTSKVKCIIRKVMLYFITSP